MWKRDQAVRSDNVFPVPAAESNQQATTPVETAGPRPQSQRNAIDMMNIGKSVVIKGELNASEDLTLEGRVEGTIQLRENVLTIGPNGNIVAQVFAKSVIVLGSVKGDITASDKVEIRDGGAVDGNIVSHRVAIADGAHFRGSVDMQKKGLKPAAEAVPSTTPKPVASSGGQQPAVPIAAAPSR